jgi:hypothetical protein
VTTINLAIGPIVSLIAGVLILIIPRLLNFIVAIYLIIIGLIGIFGWSNTHIRSTAIDRSDMPAATAVYVAAGPAQMAGGARVIETRIEATGGTR